MMLMEPPPSSRRAWCIRAFTVSWNQQRSTPTGRGAVGVHRDFRRGRSGHDQPRDFKGFPRTMSTGVCERHTCGESWGRVGAGRKSEHGEWHPTLPPSCRLPNMTACSTRFYLEHGRHKSRRPGVCEPGRTKCANTSECLSNGQLILDS